MENQHRKISGYRELNEEEVALMNEIKSLATKAGELVDKLEAIESTDKRNLENGRTRLQEGFMWTVRSVAKPTTFS